MVAVLGLRDRLQLHADCLEGSGDEGAIPIDRALVEGRRLVLDHPRQEREHLALLLPEVAQKIGHVHLLAIHRLFCHLSTADSPTTHDSRLTTASRTVARAIRASSGA